MPEANEGFPWCLLLAGVIVGVMFLGSCPHDGADAELARTAREAVQMAHEAQSDERSAVLWTGRFRMLAIVIGVSVPIVVVYLIWRSSNKSEIDAVEVLEAAERYALPDRTTPRIPSRPLAASQPIVGTEPDDAGPPGAPAD